MIKRLTFSLLILGLFSCRQITHKNERIGKDEVKITWVENLSGDFSFRNNWDYPEGVYMNEFGQLSCDGICPPETDRMKDENGKILRDSLTAFYRLVDTTHKFYSIHSEARCYEWAGTNFISANKVSVDTVACFTANNAATHTSLNLKIANDKCIPTIELNSITNAGTKTYSYKRGAIKIDKNMWDKGVLKAEFDFEFNHQESSKEPMYWKGKIYTSINAK